MGIYGAASDLIDSLQAALERGEPVIDLAPQLMQMGLELMRQTTALSARVDGTLVRVEGAMDSLESLARATEALNGQLVANARIEQRRLELEVLRLERLTQSER